MTRTTHDELLKFFSDYQAHTVADISQNLNLTKADIRYQLKILIKEGFLIAVNELKHYPHGRPATQYKLNQNLAPENTSEIVDILLMISNSPEILEEQIASGLLERLKLNHSQSLIGKLNQLVEELNSRNYNARWESHPHGPMIIFTNCPYYSLLSKYPHFCKIDKVLIERATNQRTIIQTQSFREDTICKYQVLVFSDH